MIKELNTGIVLLLLFSFSFVSCENDMAKVNKVTSLKEVSSESGKDIDVLYSNSGRVKAQLSAPTMIRYHSKEPYTEMPDGLKIEFYDDSLNVESRLTAGYGISYDKSDEMIARNNVEAINVYGDKLNTEELVWNQKTEKISSDKFVKITTKDEIIFGDGFESNQDITNYKIKKIRGTIRLKDSPVPQ